MASILLMYVGMCKRVIYSKECYDKAVVRDLWQIDFDRNIKNAVRHGSTFAGLRQVFISFAYTHMYTAESVDFFF